MIFLVIIPFMNKSLQHNTASILDAFRFFIYVIKAENVQHVKQIGILNIGQFSNNTVVKFSGGSSYLLPIVGLLDILRLCVCLNYT